jgi:restriction endonuclease Mrr
MVFKLVNAAAESWRRLKGDNQLPKVLQRADLAVSEPEIRAFSGSLGAAKANKGVFVTISYFTKPAIDFAERHPFQDGAH